MQKLSSQSFLLILLACVSSLAGAQSVQADNKQARAGIPSPADLKKAKHSERQPTQIDMNIVNTKDPFELGKRYAYSQKYDQALKYLDQVIAKNPNNQKAYSVRAFAYEGLGKHEQALADCNKAIELDPTDVDAYGIRSNVYQKTHQIKEVIADNQAVMTLNEQKHMKNNEKYLDVCNQELKKEPNSCSNYLARAGAYRSLHQMDKAIGDYNEAIKKDPNSYLAYFGRGSVYMTMNRKDLADLDFAYAKQITQVGSQNKHFVQNNQATIKRVVVGKGTKNQPPSKQDMKDLINKAMAASQHQSSELGHK